MEFNFLHHFKDLASVNFRNPNQVGSSLFLGGNMGSSLSPRIDAMAEKAKVPRRDFLKTSLGFSAAMLAANQATGMTFFEVDEVETHDSLAKWPMVGRFPTFGAPSIALRLINRIHYKHEFCVNFFFKRYSTVVG